MVSRLCSAHENVAQQPLKDFLLPYDISKMTEEEGRRKSAVHNNFGGACSKCELVVKTEYMIATCVNYGVILCYVMEPLPLALYLP